MKKYILVLAFFSMGVHAAPAWYFGNVTRVWHYSDDGFILTFDSSALSDCKHNYVYFKKSEIGEGQEKAVYSMALSAFHAEQKVGVVIDKSLHGEYCHGLSMDLRK